MTSSILQNNQVYRSSPQTNNFGTVQTLITAATPLGETYNVKSLSASFTAGNVAFKPIDNQFQFDLYKATKPKVIFSKYITRVVPDASSNTQTNPNQYYPVVSFKIDFEACCVGGMCLNFTTDIQIRDYSNSSIVINGYSSNGAVQDVAVPGSAIKSFQIAYGLDFVYNYINKIKLGFCNVGGGNIIWHQEVPGEIAKIYHDIISSPGMSETIRRMVREDVFIIQHNPYHQYGNFQFQLKSDNALNQYQTLSGQYDVTRTKVNESMQSGFNEIGIYWVDTKLKQINMTPSSFNTQLANKQNYAVGTTQATVSNVTFSDERIDEDHGKTLAGFTISAIAPFMYGEALTVSYDNGESVLIGQLPVIVTSGSSPTYTAIQSLAPTFQATGAVGLCAECNIPQPFVQGQLNFRIHFFNVQAGDTGSFSLSETAVSNSGVILSLPALYAGAAITDVQQVYMNGVPGTISALPSGYTGKITSVSSLANWVNGYTNQTTLFVQQLLQFTYALLLKTTGAVCPYLNVGNFNYINLEVEKYNDNDYALNGLAWYYLQGNYLNLPNPGTNQAQYQIFRYNAAILNNHENEEYQPSMQNIDYQSIHTFRKDHGIVDFYFPLNFLFICQGVAKSFPHYACSAQSIKVEFEFNNPLALMNTCLAVNPASIDYMDYSTNCRLFINRVDNYTWLQSNGRNIGFVLYYTKYVWIPTLIKAIMNYPFYSWPQKNYERFMMTLDNTQMSTQREICQLSRSVFYTKIYMFVTSAETVQILNYGGGPSGILPLYVNKYDLPIYDVLDYAFTNRNGNNLTGSDMLAYTKKYNSVYSYVPFESVQLQTDSQLHMTDETPFRAQMFLDYSLLEWTQCHSALKLNNLITFDLDSLYYQVGAPNALYSPAYGPYIKVFVKPKQSFSEIQATRYGIIIISECINISYIQNHVMMVKFQTNN